MSNNKFNCLNYKWFIRFINIILMITNSAKSIIKSINNKTPITKGLTNLIPTYEKN